MILKFKWIMPSKKNSKQVFCRWGRPTVIPSKAYIAWHNEMANEFKNVKPIKWWWLVFNYIFLIPYLKGWEVAKKWFDYSNKIESINDLLVDLWIIEEDNYLIISEIHITSKFVPYGEWWVILEIIE